MKKQVGCVLIIIALLLCMNTGCVPRDRGEEEFDLSVAMPQTAAESSLEDCFPGRENPDKDGMDNVTIYAVQTDRLANCRSYDDGITKELALGIETVLADVPEIKLDGETYWKETKNSETGYEIVRLNVEYAGDLCGWCLKSDNKLYRSYNYKNYFEHVGEYSMYVLTEEQAEVFMRCLEENAKNLTPIADPD